MTLERHVTELTVKDLLSPALKQVGAAAKDAAGTITKSFNDANESQRRFNVDRAALVGGLRELQGAASDFARSAAEEAAGQERLQVAIENTGRSYDQVTAKVDTLVKRGVELSFADDQVVEALTRLTTTTGNADTAMADLGLAMDLARARHIDLATAADIVGKVATGNTGILARYGIAVQNGATANEALLAIQQRVAGQSEAYATTVEGNVARISNAVADFGENLFGQNEQLQTFLALMPGVNAAYSTLAGVISGLGGFGAIAGMAGPLALVAGGGALAYGYAQGDYGETAINTLANQFFLKMSEAINALTPGSLFDTGKYTDQLDVNKAWSAVLGSIALPSGETDMLTALAGIFGVPMRVDAADNRQRGSINPPTDEEIISAIQTGAASWGMTVTEYIDKTLSARPGMMRDPITGKWETFDAYVGYTGVRSQGMTSTATSGRLRGNYGTPENAGRYYGDITPLPEYIGPYQPAGAPISGGRTRSTYVGDPGYQKAGVPFTEAGADSATGGGAMLGGRTADNIARAIKEQADAYYGLATAQEVARQGMNEFKATQDSLLGRENVYSQQIGEYNSQLDAQTAAYDILKKRQEDGVSLTAQQTDFLNKYNEANARGTAGVEDATVAQGMLAQQYLLNMEKGDQLNASMQDQTGAVGDLVTVIEELILSLYGVPEEVRTRIELDRAAEAGAELQTILDILNSIDGRTVNFVVNASGNGVSLGNPNGPSIDPGEGYVLGGMLGAAHGRMLGRGYTLVGEDQPELLVGGRGGMVIPGSATRAIRRGSGGGDTIHINAPITVIANDPRQFGNALRENAVGASR